MDMLTKRQRSENMAKIASRDTGPELIVRRSLHRLGYRFSLHKNDLPGKPDVILARHRVIFLVNGCFWHRHPGCRFAYTPKSRVDFWTDKFEKNLARDRKVLAALEGLGWTVHIIWGCETRDPTVLRQKLCEALRRPEEDE